MVEFRRLTQQQITELERPIKRRNLQRTQRQLEAAVFPKTRKEQAQISSLDNLSGQIQSPEIIPVSLNDQGKEMVLMEKQQTTEKQEVLSVLRDTRGRVRWKLPGNTPEENEQLGIRNIQALFLEKFPEFNELFPRGEDGKIAEDGKGEAKVFILERMSTVQKVTDIFGSSAIYKKQVPYLEGSYTKIIKKFFSTLGIEFEDIPRIDKKTGLCEDDSGGEWVGIRQFAKESGISKNTVGRRLKDKDIPTMEVRDKVGRLGRIYSRQGLYELVEDLVILPQVDKETESYRDQNNIEWLAIDYVVRETRVGRRILTSLLKENNISLLKGRDKFGHLVDFYPREKLYEFAGSIMVLPKIDQETRFYKNGETEWITINAFVDEFAITDSTLKHLFKDKNIPTIKGKSSIGKIVDLYPRKILNDLAGNFISLPLVNKQTGVYIDQQSVEWITYSSFSNEAKVASQSFKRFLINSGIPTIKGRDRMGKVQDLYPKSFLARILQESGMLERKRKKLKGLAKNISPEEANENFLRFLEEGGD